MLFGVPGTVGAAATIMDGHPLAKKGQAGRAFGAAYMSSLLGGIAGAFLLAISFPILRPIILYLGSPELLAICVFGLSMVAALSGKAPLKGMAAAGLGLLVAMIGSDPQTGTLRWTFESLYLWDGIPLVPITLGIFAIPELADLAIARLSIASGAPVDARVGQLAGIRDALRHWWLVLRCSWLGASLGAVPGIGSAVIDWIAYGHALKTEKNVENFGQGDIRGVIAPESSNNAKEGCALVPTLAFGVPGSASMAILLGAFMMHGLVPGPRMLDEHLDVTYSIVWSIALANLLGAGLCLAFSNQLAKVASVRVGILLPLVLAIIFMGAFQGSRQWGDLYVLLGFGAFGWIMKRLDWPRPPLILGVVLGGVVERYLFISIGRYQWTWIARPVVIIFFAVALFSVLGPLLRNLRTAVRQGWSFKTARPRRSPSMLFTVVVVGPFGRLHRYLFGVGLRSEDRPAGGGLHCAALCPPQLGPRSADSPPAGQRSGRRGAARARGDPETRGNLFRLVLRLSAARQGGRNAQRDVSFRRSLRPLLGWRDACPRCGHRRLHHSIQLDSL